MRLHREGYLFISITILFVAVTGFAMVAYDSVVLSLINTLLVILLLFFIQFFRNPKRIPAPTDEFTLISPADGRVVAIEEINDVETGLENRIQVSIFMSPFNVHINRVPIDGHLSYYKYHKGKYLIASHPKSSLENERNTHVIDTGAHKVVVRQIAGAVARRIVSYPSVGDKLVKGNELGFIKFGSRCDMILPAGTELNVKIGDQVKGNINVIGRLPYSSPD